MYARCRACGEDIVWFQKRDGSWNRPLEVVASGGLTVDNSGEISLLASTVFRYHECNPQLRAELEFRKSSYDDTVRSIDCPHPRCNGVKGGPCKSLVDGVTDLRSYHPERVRAIPRSQFPKGYGGKL